MSEAENKASESTKVKAGVSTDQSANESAGKAIADAIITGHNHHLDGPDRLLYLLPEEIVVSEDLDVRPWSSKHGITEAETAAVENFAMTIQRDGQLQPVKVRYGKDGQYELIMGRRRVEAIRLLNAALSAKETPIRVKAVVATEEVTDAHAHRQAMVENIHRQSLSPMDLALDIERLQKKGKAKGTEGVKKIAEYLGVSPATVTQHMRLLLLSPEVQEKVHTGELSRDAAFALTAVPKDQQVAVVGKAAEKQKIEQAKAATQPTPTGAGTPTGKKKSTPRKTGTIQTRHVKDAVRETPGVVTPQPRSKKEIVEYFEGLAPNYGYPDGAVQTFVRRFGAWVAGELTDRTLTKYWDAMVEKAPKGTKESETKAESESK